MKDITEKIIELDKDATKGDWFTDYSVEEPRVYSIWSNPQSVGTFNKGVVMTYSKVADGILSEQDARLVEYYRWAAPKLSEDILTLLKMHSPVQAYAYPDKCADPTLHREHWGVSVSTMDAVCPKCPLDTYFCLECFGEEYPCNTAQVLLGVKEA